VSKDHPVTMFSDFDEVVIPAYDSIGAYSFQVGPSAVRSFGWLVGWLVGWFVRSFVRSASDCECNLFIYKKHPSRPLCDSFFNCVFPVGKT
jgi:hypothetical protein